MSDRLVKIAGLYRNVSHKTGREYWTGNLTLFTKVLIFENPERKNDTEPSHILYIQEREPKSTHASDERPLDLPKSPHSTAENDGTTRKYKK